MFDGADYEFTWPADLFVAEEAVLLRLGPRDSHWRARVELLLTESFAGPEPRDDFHSACAPTPFAARSIDPGPFEDGDAYLEALVQAAPRLRSASAPRPYWRQRQNPQPARHFDLDQVMDRFVRLIDDLERRGYFEQFVPKRCVDDHDFMPPNPSALLEIWVGEPDLWPLSESRERWGPDVFHTLVEVLHDRATRPRERDEHTYYGCGWHFFQLAPEPGRRLYRWQVNQLLDASTVPFRLADDGEDVGRLVAATDEARADLVAAVVRRDDPAAGDRVRHAVAQFRARGGSAHDKRSAVMTLALVLEERRALLKAELLRRDEGALFQIANEFAIRHQNEQQKADHSPVFLDWVFWWYLATIELTDRITDGQGGPGR